MKRWIRQVLIAAVMGLSFTAIAPTAAKADDYWDGYWNWYDNNYRPYYHRYYNSPQSQYYRGGQYYNYPGRYYGNRNYGNYYGNRNYGRGGGVQVGPLRFGWW